MSKTYHNPAYQPVRVYGEDNTTDLQLKLGIQARLMQKHHDLVELLNTDLGMQLGSILDAIRLKYGSEPFVKEYTKKRRTISILNLTIHHEN